MRLRFIICFFSCLFVTSFKSQTVPVQQPVDINPEIAFVSDTQAPLWLERIFLRTHNNRTATRMIFTDILARHPLSLFLLGDVVSLGSSNRAWREMTKYLAESRDKGIRIFATMGNHEVMGSGKMGRRGQEKFQSHFPEHLNTGFAQVMDSVAVILLNSNFTMLTKKEDGEQVRWYKDILEKLDKDPSIQYIITGCHHSPYSNSRIVGSSKAVQQKFVIPFSKSTKSCLFLSGHSHAFEHFKKEGKDFLVIGGGGGLHQPLGVGTGEMQDLSPGYKPMFHYLTARREKDHLLITSYQLKDDFVTFTPGLIMNINLPSQE
ncbi:MAG: Calcineurin-like phosphoesterase [Sediminibacterium sp.]|nr:Calcineurin-like phosphoesterase [Sediminibacterium sp.]